MSITAPTGIAVPPWADMGSGARSALSVGEGLGRSLKAGNEERKGDVGTWALQRSQAWSGVGQGVGCRTRV